MELFTRGQLKIISYIVIFFFSLSLFNTSLGYAEVDFSSPVCAVDVNGNGDLEESEYANCNYNFVCPFDINAACSDQNVSNCNCPSGTTLDPNRNLCIGGPPSCGSGVFNPVTNRCEAQVSQQHGECREEYCCYLLEDYSVGSEPDMWENVIHRLIYYTCRIQKDIAPSYKCSLSNITYSSLEECQNNCANTYCQDGWIYDASRNICYGPPQCPPGTHFDSLTDSCVSSASCSTETTIACSRSSNPTCAEPGQLNLERQICEADPYCNYEESNVISQTFLPQQDTCRIVKQCTDRWECPATSYSSTSCDSSHKCTWYASPICPSGLSYSSTYNRCQKPAQTVYDCSLGGTYSSYSSCHSNCKTRDCWQECHDECTTEGNSTVCNQVCETRCSPWSYGSCTSRKVCDAGSLSGNYCIASASCPSGLTLNTGTDRCEKTGIQCNQLWECPGYEDSVSCNENHQCIIDKPPQCPANAESCCPSGYTYNSELNMCIQSPPCEYGTYNAARDRCEINLGDYSEWVCDATGQTYSSEPACNANCRTTGTCVEVRDSMGNIGYSCGINNAIYTDLSSCYNQCRGPARCRNVAGSSCPGDYLYDVNNNVCYGPPACAHGGQINYSKDRCEIVTVNCESNYQYSYSPSSKRCEANISCHEGYFDSSVGQCVLTEQCENRYTCPLSNDVSCITIDPSLAQAGWDPLPQENADLSYYEDDSWSDTGDCNGQIYFFSGTPNECLLAGIKTGFKNCCDECDSEIKDNIGKNISKVGSIVSGIRTAVKAARVAQKAVEIYNAYQKLGGAMGNLSQIAAHHQTTWQVANAAVQAKSATGAVTGALQATFLNPTALLWSTAFFVAMKALEFFMQGCNGDSILTNCFVDLGLCHYVGNYCKKKWPITGGCAQKAKVYCCYNSKLARIINEGARQQLTTLSGWGTPKSPNCRGLTPEEFQMLDFSRIDLSEWYEDIETRLSEDIQQKAVQNIENYMNSYSKQGTQ